MKAMDCLNSEGGELRCFLGNKQIGIIHMPSESTFNVSSNSCTRGLEDFFIFFICFSRFCSVFVSLDLDRTFSEGFFAPLAISSRFFNSVEPQRRQQKNLQTVT